VCLALECFVFAIIPLSTRYPVRSLLRLQACVTAILFVAALLARRSEAARPHWQVLYAFFVGSMAVLLSTLLGSRLLEALPLVPVSPAWIALSRLSEAAWRVGTILLLMAAGGASLRSMYLTRARLGLGLTVGLAAPQHQHPIRRSSQHELAVADPCAFAHCRPPRGGAPAGVGGHVSWQERDPVPTRMPASRRSPALSARP